MNRYEIVLCKKREFNDSDLLDPINYIKRIGMIKNENKSHSFKREFLCEFVAPTCSVTDSKGNHCPEKPEHFFEYHDREVGLCKPCYENYKRGTFDQRWQRKNYGRTLYKLY